eukprot:GHVT01015882.1.p1 GENE.GHVT01015882.1~~GHVT01015882.1.p1  ORF type:complete len:251 (+),score=69.18 GHVT01015882.1:1209-1961(+)
MVHRLCGSNGSGGDGSRSSSSAFPCRRVFSNSSRPLSSLPRFLCFFACVSVCCWSSSPWQFADGSSAHSSSSSSSPASSSPPAFRQLGALTPGPVFEAAGSSPDPLTRGDLEEGTRRRTDTNAAPQASSFSAEKVAEEAQEPAEEKNDNLEGGNGDANNHPPRPHQYEVQDKLNKAIEDESDAAADAFSEWIADAGQAAADATQELYVKAKESLEPWQLGLIVAGVAVLLLLGACCLISCLCRSVLCCCR